MGVGGWVGGEMEIKANLSQRLVEVEAELDNKTNWKIARHFIKLKLNNDGWVQTFQKYVQSIMVDPTNLPKESLKYHWISMIHGWVKIGGQLSF